MYHVSSLSRLNELREMFLSFFESKGHLRLPSFSLVPQNDKSILLINAGMTPMKPWFKGEEEPPPPPGLHLSEVHPHRRHREHRPHRPPRHLFRDAGQLLLRRLLQARAIHWSWEFLTSPEWVGIDPDRLYPSIYVDDDEAFEIWNKEVGIAPERIFRFGKEDNFWSMAPAPAAPALRSTLTAAPSTAAASDLRRGL